MTRITRSALLAHAAFFAFAGAASAQTAPTGSDATAPQTTPAEGGAAGIAPAVPPAADIVVTGNRQAQRKAIAAKRAADNVVETLFANDVGKLPDQNVAEAVRRLPGVSVANDQGEGRYVVIRGIAPNLVNVTLNGQTLPAPEPDSRQVKLDDIPSAMIAAVTVTKSLTPDQDGAAVGGEVNIRTLSAFDRNKPFFMDVRGAYGIYKKNQKNPFESDIVMGGTDGRLGVVISANYSRRPIESENFQGGSTFGTNNAPDQFGLRDYNLVRERIGVVANFDYRVTDAFKLFLRTSYSYFSDDEVRDQDRADSLVYSTTAGTSGTFTGRGSLLVRRRIERDNTKSAELGGEYALPGGGKLEAAGTWTRAIKNDPLRSEFNFRGSGTAAGTFDVSQSPYLFAFTTFDTTKMTLNSVNYDKRHAQDDLYQGRIDLTMPIFGQSSFKVGGKYLEQIKTNNRDYQQYSLRSGQTFTGASVSHIGDTTFYDGEYYFGPRVDYDVAQGYVDGHPGVLAQSASNLQSSRANSQVNDYYIREQVYAGYAMATLKAGNLTVIPGVRVEHTKDYAAGKLLRSTDIATDQSFNSFSTTSYTDWMPGVNVRYDLTPQLVARAAATTSIGRPNFPDLTPYISIDQTASPTAVTLGNPGIKHYKAVNLDGYLEFYPTRDSLFSAGVFYKHLDNPIYTVGGVFSNVTYAGQTFTSATVTQAQNANSAYVLGIEGNAQIQFTFLPGFFSGFGVSANYTHVDGHGKDLPNRAGRLPLFLQSKNIGTAQLFYEKYGWALRVAYSYRSAYLDTIGATAATDQFTDNNGQLDAHVSWQPNTYLTLFADGTNLNDAPWRRYQGGNKLQLLEREQYDMSFRAGVQLHF